MNRGDISCSAGDEVADLFATLFLRPIYSIALTDTSEEQNSHVIISDSILHPVTLQESSILKVLKRLDHSKEAGPDGLLSLFDKGCALSLKLIFSSSLHAGIPFHGKKLELYLYTKREPKMTLKIGLYLSQS